MSILPERPDETLVGDRITLTIPAEDGFQDVAQLVLAGVASRLNLTYESLDDLGTALATLLERRESEGELTIELALGADTITAVVGPFPGEAVLNELEKRGAGVGLRRVLETVVDSFGALVREDGQWVELQKHVRRAGS